MRNCSHQGIFPDHESSEKKTSWYSIQSLLHWKKDSCNSYIDVAGDLADHDERRKSLKASMREANTCLKAMKRVTDVQKRKFGVLPVLLGVSANRSLERKSGTVEKLIDHEEAAQINKKVDRMEDELF